MFAPQALGHLWLATLSCANQNSKLCCRPANHGPHFQPEFQVWLCGTALTRHAQGPIIRHAQGPRIQSPAPEAKQGLDRQGKTDSQSGRRLDSLSTRQPNIVSTVSPACTACQFGEVLMLPQSLPVSSLGDL